ncbi:hypothetical protein RO3G_03028 [Rhizopus delemar RA 99-880]|uniref:Cytochrome c oxidase assembly protein COX20, mitochondrial n=1 Tax=Rhizopus delemar (strain RA 99-880 / ATCC MYA-4621 / FGSC 9543 / NRRL 43880) TaxID=246409 RepID=I1BQ44_RHIO9|nr:hypothetical protein RO3G_03028 [Rhizopus delemar RA 99-880]|eukprot:EIE78324.1 hypothetical protein RO3G_03028 [Rhizopus delemar RA 99-880]
MKNKQKMSSQQDSPSFVDALKTIKLEDFKEVNKIPCSRNALLYGMAAGVTIGAIRFMSKRKLLRTWNKTEILNNRFSA